MEANRICMVRVQRCGSALPIHRSAVLPLCHHRPAGIAPSSRLHDLEAVAAHCGDAPRPPYDLQQLLWPEATDGSRPWITELGWTLVPGGSHPRCLHADIVRESFFDEHPRETGRGRFHHIAWKSSSTAVATAGTPHCTTEVVAERSRMVT